MAKFGSVSMIGVSLAPHQAEGQRCVATADTAGAAPQETGNLGHCPYFSVGAPQQAKRQRRVVSAFRLFPPLSRREAVDMGHSSYFLCMPRHPSSP